MSTVNFPKASVADVLRCNQRDQAVVRDLESQLHSFFQLFLSNRTYLALRKLIPAIANVWYYYMTSFGNLQTLGEEYTGTIRLTSFKTPPTRMHQLIWFLLYIGGELLVDRILTYTECQVTHSTSLTEQAQNVLTKCIHSLKLHKTTLQRIHHALFYIDGKYYNISNRITGIRYVLLRDWFQNDLFSRSFNLLGKISLFYILFNMVQTVLTSDTTSVDNLLPATVAKESSKFCILCVDTFKSPTATPCGHIFCWDCLCDSLKYKKVCPMCREEVFPNKIIFLQNYN